MKIEISCEGRFKIINVHEFSENNIEELDNIINSFNCFYPWYVAKHDNGVSKTICNLGGWIPELDRIKIYNRFDFKL